MAVHIVFGSCCIFHQSTYLVFSADLEYFRQRIPVFDEIAQILPAVGWAILIGNLAFQALCVPVMLLSIMLAWALPCLMTLKIIVSMCLILPINFRYLSDEEQARIVGYFAGYLKIAPDTLQILCVTREPDVTAYIRRMQEMRDKEPSKACRDMIDDNIRTVHQYTSGGALTTRFFWRFGLNPPRWHCMERVSRRLRTRCTMRKRPHGSICPGVG